MVDSNDNIRAMEVFWSRADSDDSDDSLVQVPGVTKRAVRKPRKQKIKGKKTKDLKPSIPAKQPTVEELNTPRELPIEKNIVKNGGHSKKHKRHASLRDLCAEDKQRVANLIRELARTGEEKESISGQLESERRLYENKLSTLLEQQDRIALERELIQRQLLECQTLLSTYQQKVLEYDKECNRNNTNGNNKENRTQQKHGHLHSPKTEMPCRKSYEEEIDCERFVPQPKQHTNFNNQATSSHKESVRQRRNSSSERKSRNHKEYCPKHHHNMEKQEPRMQHEYSPEEMQSKHEPKVAPIRHVCKTSSRDRSPPGGDGELNNSRQSSQGSPYVKSYQPYRDEDRPFTSMIDNLIADEKRGIGKDVRHMNSAEFKSTSSKPIAQASTAIKKDKLFGIGPLQEPILSSTQRSEIQSVEGSVKQEHQSRTKGGSFQPLQADFNLDSSLSSVPNSSHLAEKFTKTLQEANLRENQMREGDIDKKNGASVGFDSPIAASFHTPQGKSKLPEYREFSPETRRQKLLEQKQLLLQEQERLRQILADQENLLKNKQTQLHQQQHLQRERLKYFEETGQFPPSDGESNVTNNALVSNEYGAEQNYRPPKQERYPYPTEEFATTHNRHKDAFDSRQVPRRPMVPAYAAPPQRESYPMPKHYTQKPQQFIEPMPHPTQESRHHMKSMPQPFPKKHPAIEFMPYPLADYFPYPEGSSPKDFYDYPRDKPPYHTHSYAPPGPPPPPSSMHPNHPLEKAHSRPAYSHLDQDFDPVVETLKNLEFLHSHGIDVEKLRLKAKGKSLSLNRNNNTNGEVQHGEEGEYDEEKIISPSAYKTDKQGNMVLKSSPVKALLSPRDGKVGDLLDIVDEVESVHSRSYEKPTKGTPPMASRNGSMHREDSSDFEEEESKVLEDVFFIK